MRILGIDPGTRVVGCGCLEFDVRPTQSAPGRAMAHRVSNLVTMPAPARGGGMRVVVLEALRLGGAKSPIPDRLTELAERLDELLGLVTPDELALEEAFCGRSVQSALRIGEARGVILAVAGQRGVPVFRSSPARVKRAVTGHGQASKEQVARMVQQVLGLGHLPEPADLTDALAVALCRAEERRTPA